MTDSNPADFADRFAHARAAMRERDKGLSQVRASLLKKFASVGLHEAFILSSPGHVFFGAYLFFKDDPQLAVAKAIGFPANPVGFIKSRLTSK